MNRFSVLNEVIKTVDALVLGVEEVVGLLEEDPSIGDNGVAELVVGIENKLSLLRTKLCR